MCLTRDATVCFLVLIFVYMLLIDPALREFWHFLHTWGRVASYQYAHACGSSVMFVSGRYTQQCRPVSMLRKINEDLYILILIYELTFFNVCIFVEELPSVMIHQSFHNLVVCFFT